MLGVSLRALTITNRYALSAPLPAAVIAAGAQAAWALKDGANTGPRVPITKTVGVDALPSGWTLVGTSVQTNSATSSPLTGWNTAGRNINIKHNNATVSDNLVTTELAAGNVNGINISTSENISGIVVEYNELDGSVGQKMQVGITCHATATLGAVTIRGNKINGTRDDPMKARGNPLLVELNYCGIGGRFNPAAHADGTAIENPGGSITIQDNFFDTTPLADSYGRTSALALSQCGAGGVVQRNIIGYGAEVLDNGSNPLFNSAYAAYPAEGQATPINANLSVVNNVFEYANGAFYTSVRKGLITSSTANYRLSTGAPISEDWTDTDNVPDAFTVPDVTGAVASSVVTSSPITISGLGPTSDVKTYMVLPTGTLYSINSTTTFSTANAAVPIGLIAGQLVRFRLTASATSGATVSVLVTIGGVTDTWSVTTA